MLCCMLTPVCRLFDSNLMVSILAHLSAAMNMSLDALMHTGGSENLNQYVHVLFGVLINAGVFAEIHANRLPVG